MTGPLAGVTVLEIGAIGPSAFATMLLADLGADVIRVDRATAQIGGPEEMDPSVDLLNRGKRSIALDLKRPEAIEAVLALAAKSDVVTEGFRPGVAERLGVGPDAVFARNPKAVYARMTGWGQDGPMAAKAGHDINYISLTGVLHSVGPAGGPPVIPVNYVGDWGGGGMYMVVGILAALREAQASGTGQVVDAAIVDGVLHMLSSLHGLLAQDLWKDERGVNMLDGGAPYYAVYETSDGKYMSVGAGENKFYALFVKTLGLDVPVDPGFQNDRTHWPETRDKVAAIFKTKTRAEWVEHFADADCCVTPVLSVYEAAEDPHVQARSALTRDGKLLQSATAPRFSKSVPPTPGLPPLPGQHSREILDSFGLDAGALIDSGVALERA